MIQGLDFNAAKGSLASDLVLLVCEAPDIVTEGWLVIGPPINPHDRIIRSFTGQHKMPFVIHG